MEKIKADEYLIKDFEMHYPHLCDDIVEYQRGEPFELIAKLNDGRVLSYYMPDDLIRYLPSESDMDASESLVYDCDTQCIKPVFYNTN